MALGDVIGRILYQTDVDPTGVERGIGDLERQVRASHDRLDRVRSTTEVDADISSLEAKEKRAKAIMRDLERQKATLKIDGDDEGLRRINGALRGIRHEQERLFKAKALARLERDAALAADALGVTRTEADRTGRSVGRLGRNVDDNNSRMLVWLRSLTRIRLHLGFMSLTVRQLGLAMVFLSPILVDLIGATGALAGVLGTALVGSAAIGGAAITGFAASVFGAIQAVKPYTAELNLGMEAQTAYNDAVREFGRNSEEAKEAQQELRAVLKQISPAAAEVVTRVGDLGQRWQRLTAGVRRPFFDTINAGLRTANALMPMFARQTTATFRVASEGAQAFMNRFRSPLMRQSIETIMQNFRSALPGLTHGFGELAEAMTQIFATASRYLRPITASFDRWATGLNQSARATGGFASGLERAFDHARSVFRMFSSFGGLLKTVLSGGADAGQNLADALADVFDNWNRFLQTPRGQREMQQFFRDSVDGTRQLGRMLQPLIGTVFALGRAFNPLAQGALRVAEAFGDIVNALLRIPGASQALAVLGGILAGGFIIRRLQGLVGALAAIAGATGLGGIIRRSGAAKTALGGIGAAAGGLLTKINPVTAALTTFGAIAVHAFGDAADRAQKWNRIAQTLGQSNVALEAQGGVMKAQYEAQAQAIQRARNEMQKLLAMQQLMTNAQLGAKQAQQNYNYVVREFGRNSLEARAARAQLTEAETAAREETNRTARQTRKVLEAENKAIDTSRDSVDRAREAFDKWAASQTKTLPNSRERVRLTGDELKQLDGYSDAIDVVSDAEQELTEAQNRRATALVNIQRGMAHLPQITRAAADEVGRFAREFRRVPQARKLLVQTESREAVRDLARVGNRLNDVAGRRAVVRILANSENAQQAIRRLRSELEEVTQRRIVRIAESGADDVMAALRRIIGTPLPRKVQEFAESGFRTLLSAIATLRGTRLGAIVQRFIPEASSVMSTIGRLTALAASGLPAITQRIIQTVTRNRAEGGPVFGGYAGGTSARMMQEAMRAAARSSAASGERGGRYTRPRYVVGEERRPEFVIATNPAYRRDNLRYLEQAAAALGVQGFFRKGRGRKGKGKGKGKNRPNVPAPYEVGGIEESQAQNELSRARSRLDRAEERLDREQSKKRKNRSQKVINERQSEVKKWKNRVRNAQARLRAVKSVNRDWETLENKITEQNSLMDQYEATGQPGKWRDARDSQHGLLSQLIGLLQPAADKAKNKVYRSSLNARIAGLKADRARLAGAAFPTPPEQSFDDWLASQGLMSRREWLEANAAVAETTPGAADDETARRALETFWRDVLGRAQRTRVPTFITEAARQLSGVLPDAGAPLATQAETSNVARFNLFRQFGTNVMGANPALPDIAAAARAVSPSVATPDYYPQGTRTRTHFPASGTVNVTNNFTEPPPDPHTWSQQLGFELQTVA